jgi:hypothetical protein
MIMGAGIVGTLYSSLWPFIYKLGTISQYNVAYYWAMMGAERWLLALRYHDAGFEGQSSLLSGNDSDNVRATYAMTTIPFWAFTFNGSFDAGRKITSRVPSIPAPGQGNVEKIYAASDSKNYNTLGYFEWLSLPLYLDTTSSVSDYYVKKTNNVSLWLWGWVDHMEATFRLPSKITTELNAYNGLALNEDVDEDTINDDIIMTWWLQWDDTAPAIAGALAWPFTLIPTVKQNLTNGGRTPFYVFDNAIRESTINAPLTSPLLPNLSTKIIAWTSLWYTLSALHGWLITGHNSIPANASQNVPFNTIFNGTQIKNTALDFAIINRMQDAQKNIYPFLERNIKFCGELQCITTITIPDRFYTLEGKWQVWDYTARIQIKKPVRETSNASSFVIIF